MKDKMIRWMVEKLSKRVLKWCVIRAWTIASQKYEALTPGEITWDMVCEMLDDED